VLGTARIIRVMIASPGDTTEEREAIATAVSRWNETNGSDWGVHLQVVMWELHATPELGERPQEIINRELTDPSDVLVAVFRARIGSPTGGALSGTVEEIQEFQKAGKPVLPYFYAGDISRGEVDGQQLALLSEFKKAMYQEGLVGQYGNIHELREHLAYHLTSVVRRLMRVRSGRAQSPSEPPGSYLLHKLAAFSA
jgi:hypothetical protein